MSMNTPSLVDINQDDGARSIESAGDIRGQSIEPHQITFEELQHTIAAGEFNPKLLSLKGILECAHELKINFSESEITETNIEKFEQACLTACREQNGNFACAELLLVAYAQLSINKGELPTIRDGDVYPPLAYLRSLNSLTLALDNLVGEKNFAQSGEGMFFIARTPTVQNNIDAAARTAEEFALKIAQERQFACAIAGTVFPGLSVSVFNGKGVTLGTYDTIVTASQPYIFEEQFQTRPIKGAGDCWTSDGLPKMKFIAGTWKLEIVEEPPELATFTAKLFPQDIYPNQAFVEKCNVTSVTSIVPMVPNSPVLNYQLEFQCPEPGLFHIITGDTCHTRMLGLSLNGKGKVSFGVPHGGALGQVYEVFFEGRMVEAAGPIKLEEIERIGRDNASQSILIHYPMIPLSEVSKYRNFAIFTAADYEKREAALQKFIGSCKSSGFPSNELLTEWWKEGWIKPNEMEAILNAEDYHRQQRSLTRSKQSSLLSSESNLKTSHTLVSGASTVSTGIVYGKSETYFAAHPLKHPRVYVLTVTGVHDDGITM